MVEVSIVIPCYNMAGTLEETLASCVTQDYPDFEVIVVDDGSTDGTPDVCRRFGSITYLRHPHHGAAYSLNQGVRLMRGKWFKWVSGDDVLEKSCLSDLMGGRLLDEGVVAGDFSLITRRGLRFWVVRQKQLTHAELVRFIPHRMYYHAWAAIISRDALEKVGPFDESLREFVDFDWWNRAVRLGVPFLHVPKPVARYRMGGPLLSFRSSLTPFKRIANLTKVRS